MQRNVSKGAPDWVRTVAVWSYGAHREVHQVLCDDRRTLLWLANQRAVEYHVPFRRAEDDAPTGLVLDLDPPEGAPFAEVVRTAGLVRAALADSGLAGGGKRGGARGLHGVVRWAAPPPRTPRPPHGRWPPAPSGWTRSWPRRPTSRRTGTAGSSSTRRAVVRARSWRRT